MSGCLVCDGDGTVQVSAGYAERMVPDPTSAQLEAAEPDVQKKIWANVYGRREVAAGARVPCKVCRPEQYLRWAGGHLNFGHSCEECSGRSRVRPAVPHPEADRKDLA
jgi:hypothetical protein